MALHTEGVLLNWATHQSCQLCGARLGLAEVEPHPTRTDWEIRGYRCEVCGPVKAVVVKRKRDGTQRRAARGACCQTTCRRGDNLPLVRRLARRGNHDNKGGKIEEKHGNTRIGSLRKEYGAGFAEGRRKDMMLKTLLRETGSASLHEYLRHHHK